MDSQLSIDDFCGWLDHDENLRVIQLPYEPILILVVFWNGMGKDRDRIN